VCFLRPNSQCAQKLFRGLGPVVIDIRLAFQTVRDAMTISPSLQNLHLMSAMASCLPRRLDIGGTRALPYAVGVTVAMEYSENHFSMKNFRAAQV
jgi:hypothetical protein